MVFAITVTAVTAQDKVITRNKSVSTEKASTPKKDNSAAKKKAAEDAAKKKAAEQAAAKKRQQEEAARKKAASEASAKKRAEEEAARKTAEEEAARRAAEADAARKAAAEEAARKAAEEAARKKAGPPGKDKLGREYVDLGLPGGVLWATCNVGASKPEEYGLYFAWGETVGYAKGESHSFDWAYYKWCNGSENSMTKYYPNSNYGKVDNKTVLDAADDAATANWGAGWRMPTENEMRDLRNSEYCKWKWKKNYNGSGVNGYEVKSKSNGNSIFLPAAGCRYYASLDYEESLGYYWSSSLNSSGSNGAYDLYFTSGYIGGSSSLRYYGRSVRAVRVGSE